MKMADDRPNHGSANDDVASPDGYPAHRPIRHTQIPWKLDDHVRRAADRAAKGHGTSHRGPPRVAVTGSVFDAAIARAPSAGRLTKRIDDRSRCRRQPTGTRIDQTRRQHCKARRCEHDPNTTEGSLIHDSFLSNGCRRAATCEAAVPRYVRVTSQPMPTAAIRDRRCSTDLVWICETRLSVTPSTSPISASVRLSS